MTNIKLNNELGVAGKSGHVTGEHDNETRSCVFSFCLCILGS
ncbi:hypothetical protein BH10ACI3_BH10ACI3_21350 [soil metagenome]